jgi:Tol biopolymer transport system component
MGNLTRVAVVIVSMACVAACSTGKESGSSSTPQATPQTSATQPIQQAERAWDIAYASPSNLDMDQVSIHVVKADGSNDRELIANAASFPSASSDGSIVYMTSSDNGAGAIEVADADGKNVRRVFETDPEKFELAVAPVLSPDGKRIAFIAGQAFGTAAIHMGNADGSDIHRVVEGPAPIGNFGLAFSPDGQTLVYSKQDDGGTSLDDTALYTSRTDGSDQRRLGGERGAGSPVYSPDGSQIVYDTITGNTGTIRVMNSDGSNDRKIADTVGEPFVSAAWSPDGNRIIFADKTTVGGADNWALFVVNADGSDRKMFKERAVLPALRPAMS